MRKLMMQHNHAWKMLACQILVYFLVRRVFHWQGVCSVSTQDENFTWPKGFDTFSERIIICLNLALNKQLTVSGEAGILKSVLISVVWVGCVTVWRPIGINSLGHNVFLNLRGTLHSCACLTLDYSELIKLLVFLQKIKTKVYKFLFETFWI